MHAPISYDAPADEPIPCLRTHNSVTESQKWVKTQFTKTRSYGKTHTGSLSRRLSRENEMAISPLSLRCFFPAVAGILHSKLSPSSGNGVNRLAQLPSREMKPRSIIRWQHRLKREHPTGTGRKCRSSKSADGRVAPSKSAFSFHLITRSSSSSIKPATAPGP